MLHARCQVPSPKSPVTIQGQVEHGQGLGHTLGIPTANIPLPAGVEVEWGVYAAVVQIGGSSRQWVSAVSIGVRPTVQQHQQTPVVECFLLDYHGAPFYGQKITVQLMQYIRAERRFDSKEALVQQIGLDIQRVKQIFPFK